MNALNQIKTVVFPVAGIGSRFFSSYKDSAKRTLTYIKYSIN